MAFKQHYCIFDFETGGLSAEKNPVIEIALIMLDNSLNKVFEWETYIKPYNNLEVTAGALKANGINMDNVYASGIEVQEVVSKLIEIWKTYKISRFKPILVGHNIDSFDMEFMMYIFHYCNKNLYDHINEGTFDTLAMGRAKWGLDDTMPTYKLGDCCTKAGVELTNAHRAMNDVRANTEYFKYLIMCLRGEGGVSAKEEVRFRTTFEI